MKRRWIRVIALGVAWVLPTLMGLARGHFNPLGLIWPTPHKGFLLLAIGYQLYRIFQPEHLKPRTVEIWKDPIGQDISLIILGFMLQFLTFQEWRGIPASAYFLVSYGLDFFSLSLLFAFRTKTVIDGQAQTVTSWTVFPKTYSYQALHGLGLIEVKLLRNGSHVGTSYFVGLFPQNGAPLRVCPEPSAQAVIGRIQELQQMTGVPLALR